MRALVLYLTSGREPMFVAVTTADADTLATSLADKIRDGKVETITAANGSPIVVNFAHVVAAHLDVARGPIVGSPPRER